MSDSLNVKDGASLTVPVGLIGFLISCFNNPFFANAGLIQGLFAHLLVGAGTSIGASAGFVGGGLALGLPGAFIGTVATKDGDGIKAGFVSGFFVGGMAGALYGCLQGFSTSSQMLTHGLE